MFQFTLRISHLHLELGSWELLFGILGLRIQIVTTERQETDLSRNSTCDVDPFKTVKS
jgi:hypothetical protein